MKGLSLSLFIGLFVWGCGRGAEPIHYGEDQCAFCKMTIEDPKFGAEIITSKGRVYKFDAIECLVSALPGYKDASAILVTPFDKVSTLTPVDSVAFLQSDRIRSPMGGGLAAFIDKNSGQAYLDSLQWLTWSEVKSKIIHK